MLMIALGLSFRMKFRDTFSSEVYDDREYMPGKSVTKVFF